LRSEVAEYNLRLLRSQINPHFIFNSINSINNFILKNNTQVASHYLIRFSQLMRQMLENSALEKVTLHKEVEFLQNYLELEQLRFLVPFYFSIQIDKKIDPSDIQLPPMLLQPYLENAIWHGLRHKAGKGEISITFMEINQTLCITITDTGVGREAAQQLHSAESHHQSKGMKITEERITRGLGGTISVRDRLDSEMQVAGTIVEIKIPL
jgi:LytS/YehU family sensor histidine kinase